MGGGSKSSSTHLSSESTTTEVFEVSPYARRIMVVSIILQFVSSTTIVFVSIVSVTKCKVTNFAGLTTIISLIFFSSVCATAYYVRSHRRICSFMAGIFAFIICLLLCANELVCWFCSETLLDSSSFCANIRNNVNMCKWFPDKKGKKTKITVTTTTILSTAVAEEKRFTEGKVIIMTLSFVAFICCIVNLTLLSISMKIGKPVYLNKKRHRKSIVVGARTNAELAYKNKKTNLIKSKASNNESHNYESMKDEILTCYAQNKPLAQLYPTSIPNETSMPSPSKSAKSDKISTALKAIPSIKKEDSIPSPTESAKSKKTTENISPQTTFVKEEWNASPLNDSGKSKNSQDKSDEKGSK